MDAGLPRSDIITGSGSVSSVPLPGIRCDGWKVLESGLPSTHDEALARESIFTIGNGFVGVRGYFEETEFNDRRRRNSAAASASTDLRASPPPMRSSGVSNHSSVGSNGDVNAGLAEDQTGQHPLRGLYVSGFMEQSIAQEVGWLSRANDTRKDSFLVAVPDPFCINILIGGELVSTVTGRILSHSRQLDLSTGELYRHLEWESSQHQRRVCVETSRFVSYKKRNFGAMRFTVKAQNTFNTDIRIISYIAVPGDLTSTQASAVEHVMESSDMNSSTSMVMTRTRNSCRRVAVASYEKCLFSNDSDSITGNSGGASFASPVHVKAAGSPSSDDSVEFPLEEASVPSLLRGGGDRVSWQSMVPQTRQTECGSEAIYSRSGSGSMCIDIVKFVGFFTEEDAPADDLGEYAESQTRQMAANGYEALYAAQQQTMRNVWETLDVRMSVHPSVSAAYRFNALQVIMSSSSTSLFGFPSRSLGGLSPSNDYHTWQVDAIIIPFLAHVFPQRARNLLEFRCRSLHHARTNAQDMELYRGAWYPYHTVNGNDTEVPRDAAYLFLNAVVAYAMRQYVTITNDFSILFKDGGAEAIIASALVYLEWGTWDKGSFHLRSVSGPDALNSTVDNNFFTNLMVQQHLEWAVQIASVCRKNDPCFWEELLLRNEMSEMDVLEMEKAAAHLLLVFDVKHRVNASDQYFMLKRRWGPEAALTLGNRPFRGSLSQSIVGRYQLCGLPDVVLATMLLPEKFTSDEMRANFNFYEPITISSESPISHGIFSVVAAQLRLPERSNRYFRSSLFANLNNSIGKTGDGVDCATAASTWWSISIGFCGMRVVQGVLHFAPTLPEDCDGYQFVCRHNGCLVKVKVSRRTAKYLLLSAPATVEELLIIHAGTNRLHLKVNEVESVKLVGEIPQYNFDGVLFDISSIVSNYNDLLYAAWEQTLTQFFRGDRGIARFAFTQEMFRTHLQDDTPIDGLKEICRLVNCHMTVSEKDDPYITVDMVLHGICAQKNDVFRAMVHEKGLVFREGVFDLLRQLHRFEIAVGCVASVSCGSWLMQQYPQLSNEIDCFVDGLAASQLSLQCRPAVDYYVHCAKKLSCPILRSILVVENADGFSPESLELFCAVVDLRHHHPCESPLGTAPQPGAEERAENDVVSSISSPLMRSGSRIISVASFQDLSISGLDRAATRWKR